MLNGVARILAAGPNPPAGGHAGMALVIDKQRVLTCAHVINAALGNSLEKQAKPTRPVRVGFPLVAGDRSIEGRVVSWHPMASAINQSVADMAVLDLTEPVPDDVGIAQIATVSSQSAGALLRVYGIKEQEQLGRIVFAHYSGKVSPGLHQVQGQSQAQLFIEPGFSGGPVWVGRHDIIGMTVAKYEGKELAAYMIPAEVIHEVVKLPKTINKTDGEPVSEVKVPAASLQANASTALDAISRFSQGCAKTIKMRYPQTNFVTSTHAIRNAQDAERYYYISDSASQLNILTNWDDREKPLSYEIFFVNKKLNGATGFEVALIWDREADAELFGSYLQKPRIQSYVVQLSERLASILDVDFIQIGLQGHLEIGYRRQLSVVSGTTLLDKALGYGSTSAANDITRLRELCEPVVLKTIFEFRRP